MAKYYDISWEQYLKDIDEFTEKILINEYAHYELLAISRGGLIPATIISHKLFNNDVEVIGISSYTNENRLLTANITQDPYPKPCSIPTHILVIDDLVDTGRTFKIVSDYLNHRIGLECRLKYEVDVKFAAIYSKCDDPITDLSLRNIDPKLWLRFPYEKQ